MVISKTILSIEAKLHSMVFESTKALIQPWPVSKAVNICFVHQMERFLTFTCSL